MDIFRYTLYHAFLPALAAMLILFGLPAAASTADPGELYGAFPTVGMTGGYSRVTGYYTTYFDAGYPVGLALSYPMKFPGRYLVADGEFLWEKLAMRQNSGYLLTSYTMRAGPLVYYPLLPYLYPYLGLYFQESTVYFQPGSDGRKEQSYKPGYAAKTGFILPLGSGIGIKIGGEYASYRISGRDFNQMAVTGGIMYNHRGFVRGVRVSGGFDDGAAKNIEALLIHGIKLYSEKNMLEAKADFLKVMSLQPGNREAESYLARISALENRLTEAENLIAAKRYFEAIPILVEIMPYMKKAGENLVMVRGLLSPEIPEMERVGINAYENKDYDLCIFNMERLLLVDPNNGTAYIYLPRARKRKEAMEKFK